VFICAPVFAQDTPLAKPAYTVISSTPNEVLISVTPEYTTHSVIDEKTGAKYERISVTGGTTKGLAIGAPAAEWIPIRLLAPTNEPATIEIVKEEYLPARPAVLAPMPKWTFVHDEFKTPVEHYLQDEALYASHRSTMISLASPAVYRTAYTQELGISPILYDARANTLTLVKELVIKITFASSPSANNNTAGKQEADLFRRLFANGNITSFYHSAVSEVTKALAKNTISYKQDGAQSVGGGQWLSVTTNGQGVYHITASDLTKAGITNPSPASLQLFGYGGATVPEDIDSATGELHECALAISTNSDGSLNEIRFYEPGLNEWYYNPLGGGTPIYSLYHLLNPFTRSGHFLLRAGGPAAKQIASTPDKVVAPVSQSTVPVVAVHEDEERYENPGVSREFVGEEIPNGRTVTVALPDLPGYTSDSTIFRPAFNTHNTSAVTFKLTLNNSVLDSIFDNNSVGDLNTANPYSARNWNSEIQANTLFHAQNNSLVLMATTTEQDAKFWLNFAEVFYRRQTSLSSGQVPFYVLADGRALSYNFTEAGSGETWDVSNPSVPVKIASASGASMNVQVQGNANGFRQFIAFNSSSLLSPVISATGSLALHDGVCQTGAEDIIVTPSAYLDAANKLAVQRRMGGQATPPESVAVVTVEDIYREFGYGSSDYTAIRNFLAYTLRHTTANNTAKPMFLTLFANGHTDFRNITTTKPVDIPIYEIWHDGSATRISVSGLRNSEPVYEPDDAFFVRLTPNSYIMDVAVGRVVVHSADEASTFVSKVIKYETSSDEGDWRSHTTFICDDRYADEGFLVPDGIDHLQDTKGEMNEAPSRIIKIKDIGVSYPNVITASGRRKPEMAAAIVSAFNSGSSIISWIGHGNPVVWAHESILTVPQTINEITNLNRLTFLTTATCDFSTYDNYLEPVSGGVMLITKADGGAVASLGTSRSVYGGEPLVPEFYRVLLQTGCDDETGTAAIGVASVAGHAMSFQSGTGDNGTKFYIMGDPSQRVLIPRQYVAIDSINGSAFSEKNAPLTIPALSQVTISGHIANNCDGTGADANFNGSATVTLFDAPTNVSVTTTFLEASPITDSWITDGPILYHGSSTVTGGRFRTTFIVPKDIKFDTSNAKISVFASSDNFKSALGATQNIIVFGIDTSRIPHSYHPTITPYIGSRAFKSGDVVPSNSLLIVDVASPNGLNTSTASIGHSFIGWTDDSTSAAIDLASTYVSHQDDFSSGTSQQQATLPIGTHVLHVRAFDALNNPAFAEVEFTARDAQPFSLYSTTISPNPVTNDHAVITFLQPASPESPVDITVTFFSVIGQKVRQILVPAVSQNSISIPFDGKDDGGQLLSNGTYFYRIVAAERLSGVQTQSAGKFVIIRGLN
jgi:hypothetical protein